MDDITPRNRCGFELKCYQKGVVEAAELMPVIKQHTILSLLNLQQLKKSLDRVSGVAEKQRKKGTKKGQKRVFKDSLSRRFDVHYFT